MNTTINSEIQKFQKNINKKQKKKKIIDQTNSRELLKNPSKVLILDRAHSKTKQIDHSEFRNIYRPDDRGYSYRSSRKLSTCRNVDDLSARVSDADNGLAKRFHREIRLKADIRDTVPFVRDL